ncbi:MAG: transglutaminase domain-containing protein [Candidatus Avispirillum sp.]
MKNESARMSKKSIALIAIAGAVLWLAAAAAAFFSGQFLYEEKVKQDFIFQQEKWLDTLDEYEECRDSLYEKTFFAFSSHAGANEVGLSYDEYMTAEEIWEYVSPNAEFNSYYYFAQLEEDQQLLYKAYEYAFDNYDSVMFVDDGIIDLEHMNFVKVYRFFLLDSALAEQNMHFGSYGVTFGSYAERVYENEKFGDTAVAKRGSKTDLEDFADMSPECRELSIKKAREIAALAPESLSELDRAKYLYKFFTEDLTYVDGYNGTERLYDTLYTQKGQCDGFSNAMSLIYEAAGIKCAEKITDYHTWLCFCADGVWYNADLTYDCIYRNSQRFDALQVGFGFSDRYLRREAYYCDNAPACETELVYADCIAVDTADAESAVRALQKSYAANGGYGCISMDAAIYSSLLDSLDLYANANRIEGFPEHYYLVGYELGDIAVIFVVA